MLINHGAGLTPEALAAETHAAGWQLDLEGAGHRRHAVSLAMGNSERCFCPSGSGEGRFEAWGSYKFAALIEFGSVMLGRLDPSNCLMPKSQLLRTGQCVFLAPQGLETRIGDLLRERVSCAEEVWLAHQCLCEPNEPLPYRKPASNPPKPRSNAFGSGRLRVHRSTARTSIPWAAANVSACREAIPFLRYPIV